MQLLDILVGVHRGMEERDYAAEMHCLQQLDRPHDAAAILKDLANGTSC